MDEETSASGHSSQSGKANVTPGGKKKANSKKMFRNNIVRQINEQRKIAKVTLFNLKVDSVFYN